MKHAISILVAVLLVAGLAARADADGTIASLSADRASPGSEIVINGSDFGGRGNKVVAIFFAVPTPSYYVFLDVVSWSSTSVRVRIPALTSNAYRSRSSVVSDPDGDPEAFPEEVRNHLNGHDVRGDLGIRVPHPLGLQNFTNEVGFTLTRALSSDVTMAPPRYKLPEDEPDIAIAKPPSSAVYGRLGGGIEVETKPPVLEGRLVAANITAVTPGEAPPGAKVVIRGGQFDKKRDRLLSVQFDYLGTPFQMVLNIVSWKDDEIVARVPAFDEEMFRVPSYVEAKALPAPISTYASMNKLSGSLAIRREPDQLDSNEWEFDLAMTPTEPDIYLLQENVARNREMWIYGSGLGEGVGNIYYRNALLAFLPRFGSYPRLEVVEWGSTAIKVRIPADVEPGSYSVWVTNAFGRASNEANIDVVEAEVIPPGVEPKDLKSRPIRRIEGDVPLRLEE